jgi:hypothetical protein
MAHRRQNGNNLHVDSQESSSSSSDVSADDNRGADVALAPAPNAAPARHRGVLLVLERVAELVEGISW